MFMQIAARTRAIKSDTSGNTKFYLIRKFSDCSSLTKATIPSKVTEVREDAFAGCGNGGGGSNNNSGTTGENNGNHNTGGSNTKPVPAAKGTKLTVIGQKCTAKVTSANKENPQVAYVGTTDKKAARVTVPDTVSVGGVTYKVTSIMDKAFSKNKKMTTVTIGKNVTSIGKNVFQNCTNLKTVTIKSTVLNKIGANAFNGDKKLVIKAPGNKASAYKSYFKNKGNKNVKVKK